MTEDQLSNEIGDRELRLSALGIAARVLQKCGEPYTVEDVRAAAQCFYGFLADMQSDATRLGLAPTQLARTMTPEEFRVRYGEQQGAVGSPRGPDPNQRDHDAWAER